jgi:hypothetical protein
MTNPDYSAKVKEAFDELRGKSPNMNEFVNAVEKMREIQKTAGVVYIPAEEAEAKVDAFLAKRREG